MPIVAFVALCTGACGNLRVDPASPRPNVNISPDITPIKLTLDPEIPDNFVIPETPAVNQVPVNGWRGTLTAAFHNAFKGGASDRVLILRVAALSFGPAVLSETGTEAVRARLRFKASVTNASGQELSRISGDVVSRDAATTASPEAMTASASQATEAMYEQIADKLAHPQI
jgi:hypothetical protein